ncbi:MAG: phycobilisome rod-core linker polypeptide [Cyanobacteria bacterium P01_F01_bin.3]
MVSTFTNPVGGSAIRLGIQPFDDIAPVQLWPSDALDMVEAVIHAVYKQVLGNAHVMESERLAMADVESQLRSHQISVRDFVRQVAKSDLYRSRFFEPCSRNRFIALNFKHLLGRAPDSYSDIADHSNCLESEGFEAEIDSYLDSSEYDQAFGENTVPYYRGYKSLPGQKVAGFANFFQMLRGPSSHDNVQAQQQVPLNQAVMTNRIGAISPVSGLFPTQGLAAKWQLSLVNVETPLGPPKTPVEIQREKIDITNRKAQQCHQGYETFRQTSPVELFPGVLSSEDGISENDLEIVIRAVYRQVMGNAHIMESERLTVAESQLKNGSINVRDFVRQVAKSELYRSRFIDNCYRYRAIELNFKHLLGRAPKDFEEMKAHSAILDTAGYEADIDSYIDSDEYHNAFGEYVVPFYRGYRTEAGQSPLGFTNMFELLKSASSSDNDPSTNNAPRLTRAIIKKASYGIEKPRDVQDILAEALRPNALSLAAAAITMAKSAEVIGTTTAPDQQEIDQQDVLIAKLQAQLAELRPVAGIGQATLRKVQQPVVASVGNGSSSSLTQTDEKAALIERLQGELMEARALATIGEARLNKWRSRSFR